MEKEKYIKEVLQHLRVSNKIKKRIKEDLSSRIDEALSEDPFYNIVEQMGSPKELADEFMENFDKPGEKAFGYVTPYEYKSEQTIGGIPLIHINTSGSSNITKTAKGIIAIGDAAIGVVAIGGVGIGVVAIGGVGIGVVAIGGVALGGVALGGVAIGGIALGAVSIGLAKAFGVITTLIK